MVINGYVTPREYAQQRGLNEEYVRQMCRAGKLPAFKLGRDWLIRDEREVVANGAK